MDQALLLFSKRITYAWACLLSSTFPFKTSTYAGSYNTLIEYQIKLTIALNQSDLTYCFHSGDVI